MLIFIVIMLLVSVAATSLYGEGILLNPYIKEIMNPDNLLQPTQQNTPVEAVEVNRNPRTKETNFNAGNLQTNFDFDEDSRPNDYM